MAWPTRSYRNASSKVAYTTKRDTTPTALASSAS